MGKLLLTNATIHAAEGTLQGDLLVENDHISAIGEGLTADDATRVIDCKGKHIVYGLVDVHVHLREPGLSHKETIKTGTMAAAHGGYTTVCSMPNVNPAPDTAEHLQQQLDIIERDAVIEVLPYASITLGQRGKGELVDFEALASKVAGFSDDGRGVQSEELMAEAMRRAKAAGSRIVAHCEVDDLLHGGYIHDGEYCRAHNHRGICSESEWEQVERDIRLTEKIGEQYHVCHISTRESVELVRKAKAQGLKVSCETGPHYLILCDMDLQEEGRFKMNPPLAQCRGSRCAYRGYSGRNNRSVGYRPRTPRRKREGEGSGGQRIRHCRHRDRIPADVHPLRKDGSNDVRSPDADYVGESSPNIRPGWQTGSWRACRSGGTRPRKRVRNPQRGVLVDGTQHSVRGLEG